VKLLLKIKNNFFAKNYCEIQVRTILICALYSIKYGIEVDLKNRIKMFSNVSREIGSLLSLVYFFVGWYAGAVSLPPGDVILA
jgi:hypothetical protein